MILVQLESIIHWLQILRGNTGIWKAKRVEELINLKIPKPSLAEVCSYTELVFTIFLKDALKGPR